MTDPRDKKPSLLKRDEHNNLDHDDARRVTDELVKKLITEERHYQKDMSFNHARTGKRDVMIFITVCHRNSVDGKIVLGDEGRGFEPWSDRDIYKYKVFDYIEAPIMASHLPMKRAQLGEQLMSCFNVVVKWMARIGAIDGT